LYVLGPPLACAAGVTVVITAQSTFESVLGLGAAVGFAVVALWLWPQVALGRTAVVLRTDGAEHRRPDGVVLIEWAQLAEARLHAAGFGSYLALRPADGAGRPRGRLWQFIVRCNRRFLGDLDRVQTDHLVLLPRWEPEDFNRIEAYLRNATPGLVIRRD
jgi:hypothetical protein